MNEEIFDVYITKYALTKGIIKKKARYALSDCDGSMIEIVDGAFRHEYYHNEGGEWHKTYEGACVRANEMKRKKIISLNKSLKKFEAMVFN